MPALTPTSTSPSDQHDQSLPVKHTSVEQAQAHQLDPSDQVLQTPTGVPVGAPPSIPLNYEQHVSPVTSTHHNPIGIALALGQQTAEVDKGQERQYYDDDDQEPRDVDPELLAHPRHRTKRQRVAPPSDAFARLTLAPLSGSSSDTTAASVQHFIPSAVAPAGAAATYPQEIDAVADKPMMLPPNVAPEPRAESTSALEVPDIDMKPGQSSWEIAPDRIYVASLDESDDETQSQSQGHGPAGSGSPDLDRQDGVPLSINQVVARAVRGPAVPITSSIPGPAPPAFDSDQGSLVLYRPPPHLLAVQHDVADLGDARRQERDEALRAFRREQEMVERIEDDDDDEDEMSSAGVGSGHSRASHAGHSSTRSSTRTWSSGLAATSINADDLAIQDEERDVIDTGQAQEDEAMDLDG